jgi:hypothetical protein
MAILTEMAQKENPPPNLMNGVTTRGSKSDFYSGP